MSKQIFEGAQLHVAAFCGPATTLERTRMRVQIEVLAPNGLASLGFTEARELHAALGRWLYEAGKDLK